MPDKPHFTAQQMIDALRNSKGMVSVAARAIGCDPDTVRSYIKRYPTVAAAVTEARSLTTDVAELALFKAISAGEAWAVKYYLSTIGKERGYIERKEITGEDGAPLLTLAVTVVDDRHD